MKNIVVLVMSTFNSNPKQTLVKSDAGEFNGMGKKSPTSIGGAMNCPIAFRK